MAASGTSSGQGVLALCARKIDRPRSVRVVAIALVVGCGDNHPCDYMESDDVANGSMPETTSLTAGAGDGETSVCGSFDGGHFSAGMLDTDRFRVTVGGTGKLLVEFAGDDNARLLESIEVRIFDAAANPTLLALGRFDPTLADAGAFLATVPPGEYDLWVSAISSGDLAGAIDYRVRITADPSDACTTERALDYTEADDGDTDTGNDAVAVDYTKLPSFAAMPGAPEPTHLAIDANRIAAIAGSAGSAPRSDQYLDRDTFELRTDDTANELTVRLDWTGDADMDYIVFEPSQLLPIGAGQRTTSAGSELATFAVRPSTTYWLWIGRFEVSNGVAVPYRAAVCGGHFFH